MNKPISIWIVISLICAYALYSAFYAFNYGGVLFIWPIFSFITVYGLFKNKSWSQILVYVLAAVIIFAWFYALWYSYDFRWLNMERNIISLIPGLFLIIVTLASCIVVYKYFQKQRKNT